MTRDASDPTLPSGGASAGTEATLAPAAIAPVVIRAGRTEDYDSLVGVDPKHYVVGKELARGGMGRIMTARDRRLGRPVAIKELLYESSDARARFEREARITAKLQHPSIVNILEAGTWPSGEPFYVMKLVAGTSLDKVIAERKTLPERLGLLPTIIAVVDALAYAHSMRVIHRDLKPGNVLVGEFGETVVIDWGLAKDLADATGAPDVDVGPYREARHVGETVVGAVMGTPAYMPAEQASGEIVDERADVYALGAMLYHVLAGEPPYRGHTTDELLAKVIKGPPPPLATRASNIPRDLITIVEKAMAHDAAGRYPSAGGLAEDLKKFQTGQLVGAHQYSTWQLVRRWIRRNKAPVAVAAIASVLLAGVGVIAVQRVLDEQARTERQRAAAVASRGEAEDLMGFMMIDLRDKLEPIGKVELLDTVAKKAIAYYGAQVDSSPEVERKRAIALTNIADVLILQGDLEGALAQHRAALVIRERLVAETPDNDLWQRDLAITHQRIGDILMDQGNVTAGLEAFRRDLSIVERLVSRAPTDTTSQHDLAVAHERIADVLLVQGDLPGALAEYRARLTIAEALAVQEPTVPDWQRDLVFAHHKIGKVLLQQGDLAAALDAHQRGRATATKLVDDHPGNTNYLRDLTVSHNQIGDTRYAQQDLPAALAAYRASLAIREQLAAQDPGNAGWQRDLSVSRQSVGDTLAVQGDLAGALAEFRATLAIRQALVAKDPSNARWQGDLAYTHGTAAAVLQRQGDERAMLAEYQAAATIRAMLAAKDPGNANAQMNLAWVDDQIGAAHLRAGDVAAALTAFQEGLRARQTRTATDPASVPYRSDEAYSHERIGDTHAQGGDRAAALAAYRTALTLREALATADPTDARRSDVADAQKKVDGMK